LPTNPKVLAFFYRGSADTSEVERGLRALGQKTGDNLFVNIASQADPDYDKAEKCFRIKKWPVIVVTAISPLAATPEGDNGFVRLDSRSLFAKPEELLRTVEELFNLFLGGKIGQAAVTGWTNSGRTALLAAAERVWLVVKPVISWLSQRDFSFEYAGVKIEVKEGGGH
jgi:hypothetical protein